MKKTARTSSLLFLTFFLFFGAPGCTGEEESVLDQACETSADCPNPARQRCVPEWGVCVGQTNELGDLSDPDAG